ncbi:MAG: HAMP domain-containing protein [Chloroflexi bacterium]|nr:HAMP domain-containing protein [Chloroflexota bacterium]
MSLRLRLTLTYSAFVGLTIAVFGLVLYTTMSQNLEAEMDQRLQIRADQVQLTIWPGTDSLTPEDLTSAKLDLSPLADLDAPGLYVQVLDRAGQVLATSESLRGAVLPTHPASLAAALEGKRVFSDITVGEGRGMRMLSVPIVVESRVVGVLEVGQSRRPLQDTISDLRTLLLLLGAATLAIAGVGGWLVARHGLLPLRAISQQAADIAAQRDFRQRLHLAERRDEVGQLARTIDKLLETVQDTLRWHREFVADTSHELRNPLLALRTNLELIDRVADAEARAECVREARQQIERMSRLVSDLLLLAQVEAGQVIERRPVALRPLIESVARDAAQRADGQQVQIAGAEPLEILGDEGRLTQVLTNLVNNALRHTPPGGTITLRLGREDGWAYLAVADSGEGIAPEHLPHIFERFYRVEKPGARAGHGTGLGLAIVKHLAEAHGGWVTAESELGRGSCFTVWLPLRPGVRPPLRPARAAAKT